MTEPIKRIGNIGFRKSTYIGKEPEFPNYSIEYWEQNPLYGKIDEYEEDAFGMYIKPGNPTVRHSKGCFTCKETCFTLAFFEYDPHEPCWELRTVGNRPTGLKEDEITDFWKIMEFGFEYLNDKL